MRILIVSNLYPPYYKGGHELQCQFAAEVLTEKGHEVYVLTSRYGVKKPVRDKKVFRVLFYHPEIRGVFKRLSAGLSNRVNYFITKKVMKKIDPDLVYVGQLNGISVFPLKALKKKRVPFVYHIGHFYFCELVQYCIREPNYLKRNSAKILTGFYSLNEFDFNNMITVSSFIKEAHIKAGYLKENISIVPPMGIPAYKIVPNPRQALHLTRGTPQLLFVGRLTAVKGIHIAVESIKTLIDQKQLSDFAFHIIGDGDRVYKEELKQLIYNYELNDRILFDGFLSPEQLVQAYDSADLLLVPSLEEPFGLIIIEAMSRGLPVVASSVGGITDIIVHLQNGLLSEPGNFIDLSRQIIKILNDPDLYKGISYRALLTVREKYSKEMIAEKLNNYIQNAYSNYSKKQKI
ncbi:MAG: glycosyltransferase family 4 protein [bacterium]|nr:glycosyltransferase family 4 protein [bacterium]